MDEVLEKYTPRIIEIAPRLQIDSLVYNNDGLANDVLIANGELVFRFAKDENAVQALHKEALILERLAPYLELEIPRPFYLNQDAMAYRLVPGETFSLRRLQELDDAGQQAVAGQLAGFLRAMHNLPLDESIPSTSAPGREGWQRIWQGVQERVFPLLLAHQRVWATELFHEFLGDEAAFDHTPRLIHGDLGPHHILFDHHTRRINGIIDFGVGGAGDPATDLGLLLQVYGESFVRRLLPVYPEAEQYLPRARFFAQAIEFQWVLLGLKYEETFWFTAHLGGRRDIG